MRFPTRPPVQTNDATESPDSNGGSNGVMSKWFGGVMLPLLMFGYGLWVVLPPHYHRRPPANRAEWIVVNAWPIVWGLLAIFGSVGCFCFYFFGAETDRRWVVRLFQWAMVLLVLDGLVFFILLLASATLGHGRWR